MNAFTNRKRARRNRKAPEIILTPLIDTALTILVIFMMAAPAVQNSIRVDLPKGSLQEVKSNSFPVSVTIDKDLELYVNDEPVLFSDLKDRVALTMPVDQEVVVINGDQSIPYKVAIEVCDALKSIDNVKYVALSTKPA